MNTNGGIHIAMDVFSENDFYVLKKEMSLQKGGIGAVIKLYDRHVDFLDYNEYYSRAFRELVFLITGYWRNFESWLLLKATYPSGSKIATYKKLWKSFDLSGMSFQKNKRTDEYTIAGKDCLSFYGAIFLRDSDYPDAAKLIGAGQYGGLAVTANKNGEINNILQTGWGGAEFGNYGLPKEIISFLYSSDIFFLRPIGGFDDREWGCVALAKSSMIKELRLKLLAQHS